MESHIEQNRSAAGSGPATAQSKWRSQKFRDHLSGYLYVSPFLIVFALFTLFPVLWSMYISLFSWKLMGSKTFIGLQNYVWLFTDDPLFWKSVGNTFSMWLMGTIPQLFLALFIATLLNANLKGKRFFQVGVIVPNVTSLVAVAVVFISIFGANYGLMNYFTSEVLGFEKTNWQASYWHAQIAVSVMVIWRWTGYNALIYLAALQSIPQELYEASTIDGASKFKQFLYITIPMIRPAIIFTIILSTIGGMQLFVEPLIFAGNTGGQANQVLTMVLYLYDTAFAKNSFGYASAIAWMLFVIIMLFSLFNLYLSRKINSTT
ncbi:carbohydrate ABC transporter permease [Paenibacillus sp. sgz302251]|uniref:carbohydrate ABC transporter permease n=1 Tax=Paenibacillus sp. sgz302251 TaxID=3414493 RepID=UPI003C79CF21